MFCLRTLLSPHSQTLQCASVTLCTCLAKECLSTDVHEAPVLHQVLCQAMGNESDQGSPKLTVLVPMDKYTSK